MTKHAKRSTVATATATATATAAATSASAAPLRIGILGCANIARAFARDVAGSDQVCLSAVASRDAARAADFAQAFKIPRHHGSYEALLQDAEVDIVYLPLPNSLHAEWAMAAARHGKHVLCEKPLALDGDEATLMFSTARAHGVMLLEAFPYWFQPQTGAMLQLLADNAIGTVRWVQASFGFNLAQPDGNIRMDPALGGGALLDAGSYPLSLIQLAMGGAPLQVLAHATWAATGVDLSMHATLYYGDGRIAQLACDMGGGVHRRALIVGSHGSIETEYLNHTAEPGTVHPWGWQASQLRVRRAGAGFGTPFEDVVTGAGSGFRFAAEAFAQKIRAQDFAALDRAAAASVANAATLAAIARSAHSGRLEDVRLPG